MQEMKRSDVINIGRAAALGLYGLSCMVAEAHETASEPVAELQEENAATNLDLIPVGGAAASAATESSHPVVANRIIDEIVVTSQKREQNIQDVPISIQAFSGDTMAARGIENIQQLGQAVPGLQYTGVGGFQLIYIRGLGTDNFVPSADPSIASYVDGIYMPSGQGATQSLGGIQRVEVLKGPQGTLFGRNATGGAISIVTADPDQTFSGSADTEAGRFSSRIARVSANLPMTSWLAASVAASYSDRESYYTNEFFNVENSKEKAARMKVGIYPTDTLSLVLTAAYSKNSGIASLLSNNTRPSTLGTALLMQPATDSYNSTNDYHPASPQRHKLVYGTLKWEFSPYDLKLIGSAQDNIDGGALDFDGSPEPIAAFSTTRQFTRQQTAELQFISNKTSWLADRFNWVGGLYYYHSKAGFDPAYLRAAPGLITSGAALAGLEIPAALQDLLDKIPLQNSPLSDAGTALTFTGILGTRSYSAYAQGTYTFTDWLDFTVGGRYQRERRALLQSTTGTLNPLGGNDIVPLINFPLDSAIAKTFSPKAVLSFHAENARMFYVSYSEGYKSGTYNIVNIYTQPNYIKPEHVTAYEVGSKLDLLSGQLRLNSAVFYNDIDDLQSGFVSLLTGGAISFVTVPHARTQGAEFDLTLVPFEELDPGLAITSAGSYIDAKYTQFPNGSGFDPNTGLFSNNVNLTGKRIVRTPKWSGNLGLAQTLNVPGGSVEAAVDGYFNSGFYYDAYNTVKENRYWLLNGRVSYLYEPWNVRISAIGKNLADRRYHITRLQTDFGLNDTLAPPREYALRVSWEF